MLTPFDAAAILIVLAATLGYLNHRILKLPSSIGLTVMGLVASLLVIGLDHLLPGSDVGEQVVGFIAGIDFHTTLMDGMLSFLLFAGALHVKWDDMRRGRWPIIGLSTGGVLLSTAVIGFGFHYVAGWLGLIVPLRMVAGLEDISKGTLEIDHKVMNMLLQRIDTSRWFSRTTLCIHT